MTFRRISLFLLLAAVMWGGQRILFFLYRPFGEKETVIEVKKGESISGIVADLEKAGLTDSPRGLAFYLRWRKVGGHLKAGEYRWGPKVTPAEIADKLLKGERLRRMVTIPEGYSIQDIAKLLAGKGMVNADSFLQKCLAPQAASGWNLEGTTLEGYLFPDTYEYTRDMTEDQLIGLMVKNFKKHWTPDLTNRAHQIGLTQVQALTLASIVEKETGKQEERPLIAGVFHNRLKQHMPLATDPSVIYGIQNFDGNIRRSDLLKDGPYNTYLRSGLPPTPISNPGMKSLEAALYPAQTEHLYFVSRNDGSHQFSKTLEEHNAAVRKYQIPKAPGSQPSVP